jgi:hypothetical protein
MKITIHADTGISMAQQSTIEALNKVDVRPAQTGQSIIAIITTPMLQNINITINAYGIINSVELVG